MYFTGFRLLGVMWDRYNRNELNRMLEELYGKNNGLQTQLNNLVISSGDSNAEVVQARGEYNLLYKRLDDFETNIGDLKTNKANKEELDSINTSLKNYINQTNGKISKTFIYSQDYSDLQTALNKASGKVLVVEPKTHYINQILKVKSHTTIYAKGSTFIRNADINAMFVNDSNGITGGYSANSHIKFVGGVFDANKGSFSDNCTMIGIGHANNIIIEQCTFKNLANWHMVEFNAVKDSFIRNCLFKDYGTNSMGSEMIQIDLAKGTAQFPWFGPYDNTPCSNITIENSRLENGVRGVGTHSFTNNIEHDRIKIKDNIFDNFRSEAIRATDWSGSIISNNKITDAHIGIKYEAKAINSYNNIIDGNYIGEFKVTQSDSRGIWVLGHSSYSINSGVIINNVVKKTTSHGVGIDYSSKWKVISNEISDAGKSGIIIYGTNDSTISNNNVYNSESNDIHLASGVNRATVNGNVADKFYSTGTTSNSIISNNVFKSSYFGGTNTHGINNILGDKLE